MKHDTPSATAALVLKALLFAAHDRAHGRLVSIEAARWSRLMALKILRWPRLFLFAARSPLCRWLFQTAERVLNPGFILHVAARKAFIDRLARTAIDAGAAQLIVVGAGYDTLALRIAASYPPVRCYEIDHPSTQEAKRSTCSRGGSGKLVVGAGGFIGTVARGGVGGSAAIRRGRQHAGGG